MPKKQNLAMLEAPPEPKSIAYVGPPYKTLPPIGSAPPTGRKRQSTTPRKLYTAPCATEETPRDERPPFDRTNSMPPDEFSESAHYQSGHTTRQTVKTDGEATVGESVGTADGRHQPRADERLNTDDGFFMTQVRHISFSLSLQKKKKNDFTWAVKLHLTSFSKKTTTATGAGTSRNTRGCTWVNWASTILLSYTLLCLMCRTSAEPVRYNL